ncbi:toprim domain-containing protein [Halopseudomonas nanhaiensis]|uniref:toprim domain-containing protein n=1 Tax=Halopseudomonas nanhaiensis TaxID=2830842 RepID=UPI001CBC1CC1|nr:toprim domain-containing protein [Halopseudomonas nanhaiensis]UAW98954.1 toprim domain-containing protein [Halopseudomonas nanhaiensis]
MRFQNSAKALAGSACQNSAVLAFHEALQEVFGQLDLIPKADGAIHRFDVPGDKPGRRNGWYVLYPEGIPSGKFGSWRAGTTHTWSNRNLADPLEAELLRQRSERARLQREADLARRHLAAAIHTSRLWDASLPADPHHPYLIQKRVAAYRLRQRDGVLFVPLYSNGQLANLQRIGIDGTKRFLPGGRVKGCYSPLGTLEPGQPLYLCEGWATGATIHAETGATVACAMNAGNLLAVGRELQRQYPDSKLIVAGDDDRQTAGNPGRTAATQAAAALGCGLILPPWAGAEPLDLTDFNDLANWRSAQ